MVTPVVVGFQMAMQWRGQGLGMARHLRGPDGHGILESAECNYGRTLRYSDQAGADCAGYTIATMPVFKHDADRRQSKVLIKAWLKSEVVVKGQKKGTQRKIVPTVEVEKSATA